MNIPLMLSEMKRVIKPGGVLSIIDVAIPLQFGNIPIVRGAARIGAFLYFCLRKTQPGPGLNLKSPITENTRRVGRRNSKQLDSNPLEIVKLPSKYPWIPEPLAIQSINSVGEIMTSISTLLQQGRKEEIWTKYCGFLDLSIDEFMEIQERLLLEQIDLLGKCLMGRMLMGDVIPTTVEEFREVVPLTTYGDYQEYLDQKRNDVLPIEPVIWAHTSGRSGDFRYKWTPYTKKMVERLGETTAGSMIIASCTQKGEVNIEPFDTCLSRISATTLCVRYFQSSRGRTYGSSIPPSTS